MEKHLRAWVAGAALAMVLGAPLSVNAATSSTFQQAVRFNMQTKFFDQQKPGEYVGKLQMTVYPDGIVNGFYQDENGRIRTVAGGVDGQNIWFDIGGTDTLHVTGTLKNGVLDATANMPGLDTWFFQSTKSVQELG